MAGAVPLPFNEVRTATLANGSSGDRYTFEGIAGDEVTISAFFGRPLIAGSLLFIGRLRLFDPSGAVIAEPPVESITKVYCDPCLTDTASFSRLDRFVLPSSGTYTAEIYSAHLFKIGGRYSIAVSDPHPPSTPLSPAATKEGSFAVRGNHQHLMFQGESGKSYGWSYSGTRAFEEWEVPGPQTSKQGSGALRTSIVARAGGGGAHDLLLRDRKGEPISESSDIGPFVYTLAPAEPAALHAEKVYALKDRQDADLFAIEGKAGAPLSVTAFFGGSKSSDLGNFGRIRLLSPEGIALGIPAIKSKQVTVCGATCTQSSVYSVHIDQLSLPENGTYFLEITSNRNDLGNYWLGIANGTATSATLPLTETAHGIFGVRGETHSLTFQLAKRQRVSWGYLGSAIGDWQIINPTGTTVATGSGGSSAAIAVTAAKSGTYRLVIQNAVTGILASNSDIGPFSYSLDPAEENTEPPTLLERFSPILHIFKEDFVPKEIGSILQESTLEPLIGDPIDLPTEDDLAARNSDLSLEDALNMSDAVAGFSPVVPPVSRFEKYKTAIYGREFIDIAEADEITNMPLLTAGREYTILQYWFFYPYNNFIWRHTDGTDRPGNNHEGDWEMIQIILDGEDPAYATYSWHWAGTTFKWDELETDDEHPHVYVGKGGHANWEKGGVRFFTNVITRGDITPESENEFAEIIYENNVTCDDCQTYSLSTLTENNSWIHFSGHWGEIGPITGFHGPTSPTHISYGVFSPINRWESPIAWTNSPAPIGWSAQANSPVNLSVTDENGNTVGQHPDGSVSATIPGVYEFVPSNNGPEYVTILTDNDLTFILEGTGNGTMDFFISSFGAGGAFNLSYEDVPITPSFYAELPTGPGNPENALFVDTNADGVFDQKFLPGVQDPISIAPQTTSQEQQATGENSSQGGGRRGSPGRGGSAVAADSSLHHLVTAAPPSLVVTGPNRTRHEKQGKPEHFFSFIDVPSTYGMFYYFYPDVRLLLQGFQRYGASR